jgi:hypothetical protein
MIEGFGDLEVCKKAHNLNAGHEARNAKAVAEVGI